MSWEFRGFRYRCGGCTGEGWKLLVRFEWNVRKSAANLRKHRVSFAEASSVFFDPLSATGDDPDHSLDERRFVTFGMSSSGRLLVVSRAEDHDVIRIITAGQATRGERRLYEED
jgi:uncharacterized protein